MTDDTATHEDITRFVIETVGDRFGVPAAKLEPGVNLETLGIDSLGGVELSLLLKKKYGVEFVAGEIAVVFTMSDIAELVCGKLGEIKAVTS